MPHSPRRADSKIVSPKKIARRLRGKSGVVFTNGCFDLLHPGHTRYLEQARKAGNLLVVALNTDASVRKLKGKDRPINTLEDRMRVLAALESVDFVTWFGDPTPLRLILAIKPQWIAKGGDWATSDIVGGKEAHAWGGRARSIPFLKGRSTTRLVRKIRD